MHLIVTLINVHVVRSRVYDLKYLLLLPGLFFVTSSQHRRRPVCIRVLLLPVSVVMRVTNAVAAGDWGVPAARSQASTLVVVTNEPSRVPANHLREEPAAALLLIAHGRAG
jgi:hypothetical protein